MKAEHRKELETNTLADKMGQVMQRARTGNRRAVLITLIVAAVLAVVLWVVYANVTESRKTASKTWIDFDDGGQQNLGELIKREGTTSAGKAARLQIAWLFYWDMGVKFVGTDPQGAMQKLKTSRDLYKEIADECKDEDPLLFLPEALLGVAVVDECRAIQDPKFLELAKQGYQALQDKKFEGTAQAKFAKDRLEQLKDAKVAAVYEDLQNRLGVRALQPLPGPGGLGPLAPKDFELPPPPFEKK